MKKILLSLILLTLCFSSSFAQQATYIGASKCKMCHLSQYKTWSESSHAKALGSLGDGANSTNQKCLSCHTINPTLQLEGVSCEVCHGAGSMYKSSMRDIEVSKKNGLIIPSEELCKKCHNTNSPNYKGFDYKTALEKISHKKK